MFSDDEAKQPPPPPISPVPRRSSQRRHSRPRSLVHKPHFDEHAFVDDYGINDAAVDPALINTQPDKPVVGHRRALSAGARRHSSLPAAGARLSGSSTAMWDELHSVRQRIERLKTSAGANATSHSHSHPDPETTPTKHSAHTATPQRECEEEQDSSNTTPHSALFDGQEPMSSPLPSKPHRLTSPSLSRQTPAERHLLEVLDRAKRTRENDILMVLLERVVTDTMYLYNHSEFRNSEPIDKVCLSLSDYILQFTESTNYPPPPPPPQPPSITRSSLRHSRSPLYETPPTGLPNSSTSIHHPSIARSASIRSEMGLISSSPISRSNSYSPAPSKRFLNPRR